MQQEDKQIKTADIAETKKGEQTFTFPHNPHPLVIKAKSIAEAQTKFEEITNQTNTQ